MTRRESEGGGNHSTYYDTILWQDMLRLNMHRRERCLEFSWRLHSVGGSDTQDIKTIGS